MIRSGARSSRYSVIKLIMLFSHGPLSARRLVRTNEIVERSPAAPRRVHSDFRPAPAIWGETELLATIRRPRVARTGYCRDYFRFTVFMKR